MECNRCRARAAGPIGGLRLAAWWCAAVVVASPLPAAAQTPPALAAASAATGTSAEMALERNSAELAKLRVEREKLEQEARNLEANNRALSEFTRSTTAWLGSLSAAIGALFGLGGILLGWKLNHNVNVNQRLKLQQDRELEREKHVMSLFEQLGSDQSNVRLSGAAMLVQRLRALHQHRTEEAGAADALEAQTITQVLISVTKGRTPEGDARAASPDRAGRSRRDRRGAQAAGHFDAVAKYIGDNLVDALGARTSADGRSSPLAPFDWQDVCMPEVYWRGVDARGVDFFRAALPKSSLREACLAGAVLMNADLRGTLLRDADLADALCQAADLRNADLRGAHIQGTQFGGAKLHGARTEGCRGEPAATAMVDLSPAGDGSLCIAVHEWWRSVQGAAAAPSAQPAPSAPPPA